MSKNKPWEDALEDCLTVDAAPYAEVRDWVLAALRDGLHDTSAKPASGNPSADLPASLRDLFSAYEEIVVADLATIALRGFTGEGFLCIGATAEGYRLLASPKDGGVWEEEYDPQSIVALNINSAPPGSRSPSVFHYLALWFGYLENGEDNQ